MDAIVTITVMEGKKAKTALTAGVSLPDQVAAIAESDPSRMAEWVFANALGKLEAKAAKSEA